MTATDELRRLLDERGVEWYEPTMKPNTTWFPDAYGINCRVKPWGDALCVKRYDLTPEQAVEATLGRGTCRLEPYAKEICGELCHTFKCSVCKSAVANPHADYYIPSHFFKYCPFCGRKVVAQ